MGNFKRLLLATAVVALLPTTIVKASEIRVGFTADALTLDPANHRNRETETIIRNMYDGILTRDGDMKTRPGNRRILDADIADHFRIRHPRGHHVP